MRVPHTKRRRRLRTHAVTQFALSGLVAIVIVGIVATFVIRQSGIQAAIRDAEQVTRLVATGVIEPNLTDGVLDGDPAAIARLDRALRGRVLGDPLERVKLWTADGRIVYSDEPRLIGSIYPLDADDLESIRTGEVLSSELSDLSKPENRFERGRGKLLEVYLPVTTPSGKRLLFETYLSFSSVTADARRIWREVLPWLAAGLLLLWLVQLPLARSLARRLRQGQREREELLVKAIEASDLERRRIASDLHDGVVQDLAGVSLSLSAAAERADGGPATDVGETLREASTVTRHSMRQLRSLLVEIHPPNLHEAGLQAALTDLAAPLAARGIDVSVDVDPKLEASPPVEQLVFRSVQEALRNVVSHAEASAVKVRVSANGNLRLVVEDDGRGFSPDALERRRSEGHLGLSLLADRAADLGGRLEVDSRPGDGTRLSLEVPPT